MHNSNSTSTQTQFQLRRCYCSALALRQCCAILCCANCSLIIKAVAILLHDVTLLTAGSFELRKEVRSWYASTATLSRVKHVEFSNLHLSDFAAKHLSEHKQREPPPVVKSDSVYPLLETYNSYEDYVNIMQPLLTLDIWESVRKFEVIFVQQ